jgi:hypothetical protein
VDAALVRGFLLSLADRNDDERTVPRVRAYLEALGRPDMRYLVGIIRGGGAGTMARYARGVLQAAGASVQGPDDQLDDPLFARSGTSVAAISYQLAATRADLGEVSRREAATLLRFVAAAEASRRVVLLIDEAVAPFDPISGVTPDVVAVASTEADGVAMSVADVPDGNLAVLARRDAASIEELERAARDRNVTLVLGGRDFIVEAAGATMAVSVGDERYPELALGPGDDPELAAAGIVTALALGAFGVRMRPEWVESGARRAAARELTA